MFQYHHQNISTIKDVNLTNKTILVRVDFNISRDPKTGKITDDFRIKAALPTIKYLLKGDNKIILCSHLGRPEGKKNKKFSLKIAAARLSKLIQRPVIFINDCVGASVQAKIKKVKFGQIVLLENLRFYPGEEANDQKFARELAALAEVYVNDGFAVCHRAQASVVAITEFLPHYAGLLLKKEVETLLSMEEQPKKPLIAIIGGLKIKDKIGVIEKMMPKADKILIGGALANTFLAAKTLKIGQSIYEPEKVIVAKELIKKFPGKLVLPGDVWVADSLVGKKADCVSVDKIKPGELALDIGEETIRGYIKIIKSAKTIFWAGPMGYCENKIFIHGTKAIARAIISSRAMSVIGGGDTVAVINKLRLINKFDHVSTGGSASLELLAGKEMPALEELIRSRN